MTEPIRWHATGLSVMQQCPEKFRRRYIEGEREEFFSAASIIGRALHHAADLGVQAQMAGQRIDRDFQVESARAHFDGLIQQDADGPQPIPWHEDPGSLPARQLDLDELVRLWWAKAPELWKTYGTPTMSESHFEVKLWGHVVTGQIDVATSRDVVIDWKSGLKPMPPGRAEREMQKLIYPAAYQVLTGRYPGLMVFCQLVRKEPTRARADWTYRLNIQEQLVDAGQTELLRRLLDDYQRLVDRDVFPLNTQSPLCSPDYCPFWRTCPAHLMKPLAEREIPGEAETETPEEVAEGG